jgi:hypothetical protein
MCRLGKAHLVKPSLGALQMAQTGHIPSLPTPIGSCPLMSASHHHNNHGIGDLGLLGCLMGLDGRIEFTARTLIFAMTICGRQCRRPKRES